MYVAIDQAEKKMLTEMKKFKAKLHPIERGKKAVVVGAESVADDDEEA